MSNEIENIQKAIDNLKGVIESGYATKHDLEKQAEAFAAYSKAMDKQRLEEQRDPIFGTKAAAVQFIDEMKNAIAKSGKQLEKSSPFYSEKANDLNSTTTSSGVEYVSVGTSSVLSYLLEQGSVNRRECTVINGIVGDLYLPKRTTASTAMVFTAADDTALTADAVATGKVTLSPKQISGLSLVSDKLLYVSAVNIAELVAIDLAEQGGKLEDEAVIRGDGTATYGSVTGLNSATLGGHTIVNTSFGIDDLLQLTGEVAEQVMSDSDQNVKFYMHGATLATLRQKKASTAGSYQFDPTTGQFTVAGKQIVIWNRMDATIAAAKIPVIYGNMKRAITVGTGREMSLSVDHSFKFGTNQTAFKLTYDWQAQLLQGTALAKVTLS